MKNTKKRNKIKRIQRSEKFFSEMIPQNYIPLKDTNNRLLVRYTVRNRYEKKQKNIKNNWATQWLRGLRH